MVPPSSGVLSLIFRVATGVPMGGASARTRAAAAATAAMSGVAEVPAAAEGAAAGVVEVLLVGAVGAHPASSSPLPAPSRTRRDKTIGGGSWSKELYVKVYFRRSRLA